MIIWLHFKLCSWSNGSFTFIRMCDRTKQKGGKKGKKKENDLYRKSTFVDSQIPEFNDAVTPKEEEEEESLFLHSKVTHKRHNTRKVVELERKKKLKGRFYNGRMDVIFPSSLSNGASKSAFCHQKLSSCLKTVQSKMVLFSFFFFFSFRSTATLRSN